MQAGVDQGAPTGSIPPIIAAISVLGCTFISFFLVSRRMRRGGLVAIGVNPFVQSYFVAGYLEISGMPKSLLEENVVPIVTKETAARGTKPKNLILLYLEGLEATYGALEDANDAYAPIAKYQSRGLTFDNIKQIPMTSWTVAGMMATQCGVPLVPRGFAQGNRINGESPFAPGLTCLGDLLKKEGYVSNFYIGSDADFAGKRRFLRPIVTALFLIWTTSRILVPMTLVAGVCWMDSCSNKASCG